jgi:hypothetical protein
VTAVLVLTAARELISQSARLLFEPPAVAPWLHYLRVAWSADTQSALDLKTYLGLVQDWFAGVPVYTAGSRASAAWLSTYPPASYLILWPVLGWTSVTAARWLWAVVDLVALVTLVRILVREARPTTMLDRAFMAAVVLSSGAIGQTIGNGQLGILVVTALVVAARVGGTAVDRDTWTRELLVVGLVTASLAKPSIAAPFFLCVLVGPHGIRRGLEIAAAYCGLTVFASLFQQDSLPVLIRGWLGHSQALGSTLGGDNIHFWLARLGAGGAAGPVSLAVLVLFGGWLFYNRHADTWLRLSVTAIVARVWVYHSWYDDILLLLPLAALYRIVRENRQAGLKPCSATDGRVHRLAAGALFALTLASLVALHAFAPFRQISGAVWMIVLAFLVWHTRRSVPHLHFPPDQVNNR